MQRHDRTAGPRRQTGKLGWIALWLLGVPIPVLLLLYFIAFWAVGTGIVQIAGAIRLRKEIDNEWMLIASGIISILFGAILLVDPAPGALGLLLVIGVYAVVYGVMLIGLAFRLRKHAA